jgi:hypothetical protein
MCNYNLMFIIINGLMEWMINIMWTYIQFYIYFQAKNVKLLKWLTNNNNYNIIILHIILKGFGILCNHLLNKL